MSSMHSNSAYKKFGSDTRRLTWICIRMRHKFMKYSMFFQTQFISIIKNYLLSGDLLSKHTSIYYLHDIYFYLYTYLYTCICRSFFPHLCHHGFIYYKKLLLVFYSL